MKKSSELSVEDQEILCQIAQYLLKGAWVWDEKKHAHRVRPLSGSTEKRARMMLYKLLARMSDDYPAESARRSLLYTLGVLFRPPKTGKRARTERHITPLTVVFKKRSPGAFMDVHRDDWIAEAVAELRKNGLSYDDATAKVAEKLGKSCRTIQRILANGRGDIKQSK